MSDIRAGIYKHYKGGVYMMLGEARHSESGERLVAYIQLSGKAGSKIWVRPYEDFFEDIEVDGIIKPRFLYLDSQMPEAVAEWYDPLAGYKGADRDDG